MSLDEESGALGCGNGLMMIGSSHCPPVCHGGWAVAGKVFEPNVKSAQGDVAGEKKKWVSILAKTAKQEVTSGDISGVQVIG